MPRLLLPLIAALAAAPAFAETPATASAPTTAPASAPATAPAVSDELKIARLISELGAEDFAVRKDAAAALKKIGAPALSQLKTAAQKDTDPEIQTNARALIAQIEGRQPRLARGGGARGGFRPFPGNPMPLNFQGNGNFSSVSVSNINGVKTIDAKDNNRSVHITEGPDGIAMSVTETKDGNPATTDYKAKDADDLKKNNPDAHAIYQQYNQGGNGNQVHIRIGAGAIAPGPMVVPVPPVAPVNPGDPQFAPQLEEQFRQMEMLQNDLRLQLQNHMEEMQLHMQQMHNEMQRRQQLAPRPGTDI